MRRLSSLIMSVSLLGAVAGAGSASAVQWAATPTLVSTLNTNTTAPFIALSDDGSKVVAVWRTASGASFKIQAASASISKGVPTWGTPTDLSTAGRTANFPRVAISADGTRATAVWTETDANANTRVATSSAILDGKTSSWGTSSYVSRSGSDAQGSSTDLAMSSDGTKAVVSFAGDSSGTDLAYVSVGSISGGTATWTDPPTQVSENAVAVNFTSVDMPAAGGAFVAAWNTATGVRTRAATVVGGVPFLETSNTLVSGAATLTTAPTLDLSSDGKQAALLFVGKASGAATVGTHVITGTVSGKTTTWPAASTQLSGTGYVTTSPQLAVSSDGKVVVAAWVRGDGTTPKIETIAGTVTGTSGTWGSITALSDTTTKDLYALDLNTAGTAASLLYANTVSNVDVAMVNNGTVASNAITWGTAAQVSSAGKNVYTGKIRLSTDGTNGTAVFVTDATGASTYSAIASISMVSPPTLTLAAGAATSTSRALIFTLSSNTTVDCATLTTDDLLLTGIKSIVVTQKDATTCQIAATAGTYWGEKGTSSIAAGTTVSVADSSGIIATTLSGTASTSVDLAWKVKRGKSVTVKTLRQKALMIAEPGTAAVSTSVITTKASAPRCRVIKKNGKASSLSLRATGACRVKITDSWTGADGTKKTAVQYLTVTITR